MCFAHKKQLEEKTKLLDTWTKLGWVYKVTKYLNMMLKEKLISAGAEKLADILLSLHESNKDLQKQLNIIFAGLDADPKKIGSIIQKEISALKRSTKFIDYYEAEALSDRLNQLRLRIANDLNTKSPELGFELMLAFLDLHENTLNRADDSNGNVGGVFREACEDVGKISENVHAPISTIDVATVCRTII